MTQKIQETTVVSEIPVALAFKTASSNPNLKNVATMNNVLYAIKKGPAISVGYCVATTRVSETETRAPKSLNKLKIKSRLLGYLCSKDVERNIYPRNIGA